MHQLREGLQCTRARTSNISRSERPNSETPPLCFSSDGVRVTATRIEYRGTFIPISGILSVKSRKGFFFGTVVDVYDLAERY